MTKIQGCVDLRERSSVSPTLSAFSISRRSFRRPFGFSILELLVVITIIIILAALIIGTVGYVQKKAALSRAEAEIAALSAGCESYKADNGTYPRDPSKGTATDLLDARKNGDPNTNNYKLANLVLYRALSGDRNLDRVVNAADQSIDIDGQGLAQTLSQPPKSYLNFKPNQLFPTDPTVAVQYLRDPFGNAYGYSTAYQADVDNGANPPAHGYNPTFDIWSTSGLSTTPGLTTPDTVTAQWIKNW